MVVLSVLFGICLRLVDERVETTEADLQKYPEIQLFVIEMERFVPGEADLDIGTFSFSYVSRLTKETVFEIIADEAVQQGWTPDERYDSQISFRRSAGNNSVPQSGDLVVISYREDSGVFDVWWQVAYRWDDNATNPRRKANERPEEARTGDPDIGCEAAASDNEVGEIDGRPSVADGRNRLGEEDDADGED